MKDKINTKFIFVVGGVCSSLGKGVLASSLGYLLKNNNLKIGMRKLDPYLNIDAGNMNPHQHGEVFVTHDGGQTDLDIGHYERIVDIECSKHDSITAGQIYNKIIDHQNKCNNIGYTVQVVPHVTNNIIDAILYKSNEYDIMICEIGGTVGDIEILPFIESVRQILNNLNISSILILLGLVPYIRVADELKTKPIQHSFKSLQSLGVNPDIVVTRSEMEISENEIEKIKLFCNVKHVYQCLDTDIIYDVIVQCFKQKLHEYVFNKFNINIIDSFNINTCKEYINKYRSSKEYINIAIIAKYNEVKDAYKSIHESISHACINFGYRYKITNLNCNDLDLNKIKDFDCVVIPGGFGINGFNGKVNAAEYIINNNIIALCICYGLHALTIASFKVFKNMNVCSEEHNGSNDMNAIKRRTDKIFCGTRSLHINTNTQFKEIYNNTLIKERFRHSYCINYDLFNQLNEHVSICAYSESDNKSDDLKYIEAIEIKNKDFIVGVQYHPEFSSKPYSGGHPLFKSLIKQAIKNKNKK